MQVRNSALIVRPTIPPIRETQPRSEGFAERQPQGPQPPVERVVQGELLSETQLSTARGAVERARVVDAQVSLDPRNRALVQAYLDVEAAGLSKRAGLDILV